MKDQPRKKIHFIGIGGIGISGLARLYAHEGWEVSGSDIAKTLNSEKLAAEGIQVVYEQNKENISSSTDLELVVYSDGVREGTPGWSELEAARASEVRTLSYFEALAEVANEYYLIAVAGTHGKTTVTAMLIDILEEASLDPTAIVGSLRTKTGSNFRAGKSKYFIAEADEYMRHFLQLSPDVLVINNIDFDHPDYFADLADVQGAFTELVTKVPETGQIVAAASDVNVAPVLEAAVATVHDYRDAINLERELIQPGLHNQQNAAAAATAAAALGIEARHSETALKHFVGTKRRFEYKGDVNGAPVYDDYAHNPQKVAAAIAGTKEKYPDRKLIVVFQPHTFSRTAELQTDFETALQKADEVILVPIYAARETDEGNINSTMIAEHIDAKHFHTLEAAAEAVKDIATKDHVVLVMGAGDVTRVTTQLVSQNSL